MKRPEARVLGFDHRPSSSCRVCGQAQHPEALTRVEVPYFGQSHELCPPCVADFESAGRVLREPELPALSSRSFPWPEPIPGDLESEDAGLVAAVQAHIDARALRPDPFGGPLATKEAVFDPTRLIRAWEAWDNALPYYELASPEHARGTVLFALLHLELGASAPKLYGRQGGPAEWLKGLADQAQHAPALRDPRVPWLQAALAREQGHLGRVDRELERALSWLEEKPGEAATVWAPVAAGLHYAQALRARERALWSRERDALKAYCQAAPDDDQGFLELAQAHFACARPDVAREILAAKVGSAGATPDAVQAEVAREVGALRPRLGELHAQQPRSPAACLAFATCLLTLGEADEAWRVLGGAEWLELAEGLDRARVAGESSEASEDHGPSALPYLALAARCALARERRPQALALLRAAYDLARAGGGEPGARRDLLAVLQQEVGEGLVALEAETRGAHERCLELAQGLSRLRARAGAPEASDARELSEELAEAHRELDARLLGTPPDEDSVLPQLSLEPGLIEIHSLLSQHSLALEAELREPIARSALDWFLGREFGARFAPLVEPPSPLDAARLRLSDNRYRAHLAYRALARRQLSEALAHDREGREALGFGAPIRLLLTYLELVRRGTEALHGWATKRWLRTLPASARAPFEVGLLPVGAEDLERGELGTFQLLLTPDDPQRPEDWPSLRRLIGRCRLVFPSEGAPEGLPKVPLVRSYVQRLVEAHPEFPLLLDYRPGTGMFRLLFGCLGSPDALTADQAGINAQDASVVSWLRRLVPIWRARAREEGLEAQAVLAPLFEHLPPEIRSSLEDPPS